MRTIHTAIAVCTLLAGSAFAQTGSPRFRIHDLGPLGDAAIAGPYTITSNGIIAGIIPVQGGLVHAGAWYRTLGPNDLMPGLTGLNSLAFSANERGQFGGAVETAEAGSDFCSFRAAGAGSAGNRCVPYIWTNGTVSQRPLTLGGNNGLTSWINSRGDAVGIAETDKPDPHPDCPVRQFRAVAWRNGSVAQLGMLGSAPDLVSFPFAVNDAGEAVGATGDCRSFNPVTATYMQPLHAVLWDRDGRATDLGTLGGDGQPPSLGNWAIGINNKGQVVGNSSRADGTGEAFLWSRETGMTGLGTLPGHADSGAVSINDRGDITGISINPAGPPDAFFWTPEWGMLNLNELAAENPAGLHLLNATSINASREIVGLALDQDGYAHAFLATPVGPGHEAERARAERPDAARMRTDRFGAEGRRGR